MSNVTVVVPNWNRCELLERLLERLREQTCPIQEVLVVDNGSEDRSAAAAEARGARVIRLGVNAGFSRAVNEGVRQTRTPWLAIVNNDVEPSSDWLEQLMETAQESHAWFAAGKLLNAARRDSIDGAFDVVCRGGCAWRAGHGRPDGPEWTQPRSIQFAPMTASLFRTRLFEDVGLLDEGFESYLEDVDFGLRCALKGYTGIYAPRAVAYHAGSATLGVWHRDTVRRVARNQVLLVAKHYPDKSLVRYGWPILVAQSLWGLVALRHGAGLAYLRGKLEAIGRLRRLRRQAFETRSAEDSGRLREILEDSEREILALQQKTGFDIYWKLYFALT